MTDAPTRKGRRRRAAEAATPVRKTDYRNLRNPFPRMKLFSDDEVQAIHEAALETLETLGMKILLPEAREIYAKAGCKVGDDEMVYIGRDIVAAALDTAPSSFTLKTGNPERDVLYEPGALIFMAERGRAPCHRSGTRSPPGVQPGFPRVRSDRSAFRRAAHSGAHG